MTRRLVGSTLVILAGLAASTAAYANGEHLSGGHGRMWEHGWGWMILGPVMMIGVIAAVVAVVVVLVRWLGAGAHAATPAGKNALDILEERFARGEIDKDEFEERRRVLSD